MSLEVLAGTRSIRVIFPVSFLTRGPKDILRALCTSGEEGGPKNGGVKTTKAIKDKHFYGKEKLWVCTHFKKNISWD